MKEMSVDDVIEELIVLDLLCKREKTIMEIAIFGGAALLIHLGNENFRGTRDIDFRLESDTPEEKLKVIMEAAPRVFQRLGAFPEWPDSELYREHVQRYYKMDGIPFENLIVFLPNIEMLALSKLISERGKDLEDLMTRPIMEKCDLVKLKKWVEEDESYYYNTSEFNFHEWDDRLIARGL